MAKISEPTIASQLDEMALKIMMVEPGDLSVVGELVVLVEGLQEVPGIDEYPALKRMGRALWVVIGQIVMNELPDSAKSYELLGQCIGLMQENYRKHGADDATEKAFILVLREIGYIPCIGDGDVSGLPKAIEIPHQAVGALPVAGHELGGRVDGGGRWQPCRVDGLLRVEEVDLVPR